MSKYTHIIYVLISALSFTIRKDQSHLNTLAENPQDLRDPSGRRNFKSSMK